MDTNAIRAELRKLPFDPFVIRLADGREIPIIHPDYVAVSPRRVIVTNQDDSYQVLEPLLIVSLEVVKPKATGSNGVSPS